MTIRGHFARVYIVNNTIFDNFCDEGVLAFRGMEKESWIFANNIQVIKSSLPIGGNHSSVDSSALTILRSLVPIPSTSYAHLPFKFMFCSIFYIDNVFKKTSRTTTAST